MRADKMGVGTALAMCAFCSVASAAVAATVARRPDSKQMPSAAEAARPIGIRKWLHHIESLMPAICFGLLLLMWWCWVANPLHNILLPSLKNMTVAAKRFMGEVVERDRDGDGLVSLAELQYEA